MQESEKQEKGKKKANEIKTFPVSFSLKEVKEKITISTNSASQTSKEEIIKKACQFHSQGNILEAAKYYQYLINQGFHNPEVLSNYGMICRTEGRIDLAKQLYLKSISLYPNFSASYSNLAFLLKEDNDLKGALKYIQKAIELKNNNEEAHLNLGWILKDLGRLKEAELSTRKAIELNPDLGIAYFNLGNILSDLGKLKDAEISARKAIELNPHSAEAHYSLGNILIDLGKLQDAELFTRKAIKLKHNFAEAYSNLGIILKDLGKLKEAEISFGKAINIKPSSMSYFAYASCLYEMKEFDSSIENLYKSKEIVNVTSLLKSIQASIVISESAKNLSVNFNEKKKQNKFFNKKIDRLIINRKVEDRLISYLYTIKTNQLDNTRDSRYGPGECSDFNLFDDPSPVISKLSNDIEEICKKELGVEKIFFCDSFFNIFVSGSGQPPHCHLSFRDQYFNLASKKYSLVYYLEIGDQNCEVPGILKLHDPDEDILPKKGMMIIIGAERFHSVSYCGNKNRVMLGINFYGL